MLDLIVSGGVAVLPSGAASVDIGVRGKRSWRSARRATLLRQARAGSLTQRIRSSCPEPSIRIFTACCRSCF